MTDHEGYLLDQLPVAVFMCNTDGFITSYNKAAAALWGRVPLAGKEKWTDVSAVYFYTGERMSFEASTIAAALKEKRNVSGNELIIEQPTGQKIHVILHTNLVYDEHGIITGTLNTLTDLSQLKPSKQAYKKELHVTNIDLEKTEALYDRMIEEVEDYAILLLDKAGNIQNWNKGAEKIKGYKEEEIIGKNFRIFYLPEDRQNKLPERLIQQAANVGKALHEGWRLRKDNTRFWGSITITAIHNEAGNVIGFSKVTRDLTEKKTAEDLIQQYLKDLEFQNNELEQFAYAAAHDMKEPIRKVQFYNNYILESASEKLSDKEKDYLSRSVNAAFRMKTLIDDLLAYSKMSAQSDEPALANLNELFAEACAIHNDTIQETNAVIRCDKLPSLPVIPFQFIRLFDNLLGNALKYRHKDKVPAISVTSEITYLHASKDQESVEKNISYYKISITDNGIGFDAAEANKIFDLFQRLHNRGNYSGTGIGLAICKKIIQNHKGFITADAELDKGAVFNLYIPFEQV